MEEYTIEQFELNLQNAYKKHVDLTNFKSFNDWCKDLCVNTSSDGLYLFSDEIRGYQIKWEISTQLVSYLLSPVI